MVYKLPKEAIGDNELDAGVLDSNLVNSFVPVGGIIMWSGTIAQAEALTNWAICDGQNGTPDLRDRFVLGVGSSVAASTASVDDTGGSNSITLTEGQMPSHNHNITDNGHSHGNGTLADATQSITGDVRRISEGYRSQGTASGIHTKVNDGNNNITGSSSTSPVAGFTFDGTHRHGTDTQGSSGTNANLPPYYALCYIMKA